MSLHGMILLLVLTLRCIVANVWLHTAIWNKYIKSEVFLDVRNVPLKACVEECEVRDRCKAVNYWRVRRKCELMDSDDANLLERTGGHPCLVIAKTNTSQVYDADSDRTTYLVKVCFAPKDNNGYFLGNMMNVGAWRKLVCDKWYKLEADLDRMKCQDDGSWDPAIQCVPIVGNFGTDCSDGWTADGLVVYHDSCYLIQHKHRLNFNKAQRFCELHNASLIHVDDKSESNVIKSYLSDLGVNHFGFWIGLSDEATEGEWRWVDDNSVLAFHDWGPRQPDNYRIENCATFSTYNGGVTYIWNDLPCNDLCKPICKIR